MVERRRGGESGVESVQVLSGTEMWAAMDSPSGGWSSALAYAALQAITTETIGDLEAELGESGPCLFVISYCDGFRAHVLVRARY
jgi:hypothetical protein